MKNKINKTNKPYYGLIAIILIVVNGCATTATDPRDPWEGWNRGVQSFNDGVDDYVMKPTGKGYNWIMPDFASTGVTNFFSNINDISVFINDFLQFKFEQVGQDTLRFLINSTVGLAVFIDVASMLDLYKNKEDFDQTLGYWGVPTGPYMVLPLFGPSTPRGTVGLVGDVAANPLTYIGLPAVSLAAGGVNTIDTRANNLATGEIATEAALDRYEFFRDSYLQQRKSLVHDGDVPDEDEYEVTLELDEDFEEEGLAPVKPC